MNGCVANFKIYWPRWSFLRMGLLVLDKDFKYFANYPLFSGSWKLKVLFNHCCHFVKVAETCAAYVTKILNILQITPFCSYKLQMLFFTKKELQVPLNECCHFVKVVVSYVARVDYEAPSYSLHSEINSDFFHKHIISPIKVKRQRPSQKYRPIVPQHYYYYYYYTMTL